MLAYAFFVVAVLCAGGRAQDSLLERCENAYPDVKDMKYMDYDERGCSYVCYGTKETSNDSDSSSEGSSEESFYENMAKETGIECTSYYANEDVKEQCLGMKCVYSSDVELCKQIPGTLQSLKVEECSVTCVTDVTSKLVFRSKGSPCTGWGKFWQTGKCSGEGACQIDRTYVSSSVSEMSRDTMSEMCKERHPETNETYAVEVEWNDFCEFSCLAVDDQDIKWEILTVQDNYYCSKSKTKVCMGGSCVTAEEKKECEAVLDDDLVEVDVIECDTRCKGKYRQEKIKLPVNSKCKTLMYDMFPVEGTCDQELNCKAEESYSRK